MEHPQVMIDRTPEQSRLEETAGRVGRNGGT